MPRLTPEQRLERARKAKAQAEAEIRTVAARLRADDRRRDTRRKIIVGGILMAQASKNDSIRTWMTKTIDGLSDRDRAAFEGWTMPPKSAPEKT